MAAWLALTPTPSCNGKNRTASSQSLGPGVTDTSRSSEHGSYNVYPCDGSLVGTPMRVCFRKQDPGGHVAILADGMLGSYEVGRRLMLAGIVMACMATTVVVALVCIDIITRVT